jgi:glyoxylase-like metal-dependent hydrolase (beta-lactamase superfamily II)
MRIDTIDLEFQGTPHVIAAFLIHGPDGPVLIETGPESTLPNLTRGLENNGVRVEQIKSVLLTHIHLDHAGAAGWWAQQGAQVYVHPVGAPHLIDPGKLLSSATRIYGDRMDLLWGDVRPAPADRVTAVADGDVLEVGGLEITAVETPGHAYHHHAYRVNDIVFTGDAAGILLPGNGWIDLPAPPPEFHLEHWKASLAKLRDLEPATLYRTHYGATSNVAEELAIFQEVLEQATLWIREMLDAGEDRDRMVTLFTERMRAWARRTGTSEQDAVAYELANPRNMSVDGILRYWRKRDRS